METVRGSEVMVGYGVFDLIFLKGLSRGFHTEKCWWVAGCNVSSHVWFGSNRNGFWGYERYQTLIDYIGLRHMIKFLRHRGLETSPSSST